MNKVTFIIVSALAAAAVVGCAGRPGVPATVAADPDLVAAQMVKSAFRGEGIATI